MCVRPEQKDAAADSHPLGVEVWAFDNSKSRSLSPVMLVSEKLYQVYLLEDEQSGAVYDYLAKYEGCEHRVISIELGSEFILRDKDDTGEFEIHCQVTRLNYIRDTEPEDCFIENIDIKMIVARKQLQKEQG